MKEYFPHDANARSDERLLELRAEHGRAGYGLWWLLVEHLREASNYRLSNTKIGGLAMGVSATVTELRQFIDYCIGLGLLEMEEDNAFFFSPALRRRMAPLDAKRQALAEAGKRGASKRWAPDKPDGSQDEGSPTPPQSDPNSQAIATPLATPIASRVEESREEENKNKSIAEPGGELATPSKSQTTPAKEPRAGRPAEYHYDEAPVFRAKEFGAYLDSIGYSHVDKAMYLLRISQGANKAVEARKLQAQATNDAWQLFIQRWLDSDKGKGKLLLPDAIIATTMGNRYNPTAAVPPTPQTTGYSIAERVKAQATKVYI